MRQPHTVEFPGGLKVFRPGANAHTPQLIPGATIPSYMPLIRPGPNLLSQIPGTTSVVGRTGSGTLFDQLESAFETPSITLDASVRKGIAVVHIITVDEAPMAVMDSQTQTELKK
jgi:hypothetical protein